MEFYNKNGKHMILEIYVKEDVDVQSISYEIDGKENALFISNKGFYAINLKQFSFCKLEEHPSIEATLKEWDFQAEKIISSYRKSLLDVPKNSNLHFENLYDNLPEEHAEWLYQVFKRLLELTIQSVQVQDTALKLKVLNEFKMLVEQEYSGKSNYEGNWWVYEIGVPKYMNEMIFILYDELSKDEIFKYMAIENFYIPTPEYEYYRRNYPNVKRISTNYANFADMIYVCLLRNILIQNKTEIERLYTLLPSLLQITEEGNGFRKDGGFIFHKTIPYTASYGEVLLYSISKILDLYYLMEKNCGDYCEQLYPILEKGYMPFLYHNRALNCVRGRACSRTTGEQYSFQMILASFHKIVKFFSKRGFIDYIFNEEKFYFYSTKTFVFNSMDRYLKRNQEYLIAISSCSKNIANYESMNGENLLGAYQSNFTFDLYYNTKPDPDEFLKANPFYRNGSTNALALEEANQTMNNQITSGVEYHNILNTCFHQNNIVSGYFSKFVLENSMVMIGTNIRSKQPYVSTIYNFEGEYTFQKSILEGKKFRILFAENPLIEDVSETRSFSDLNQNEFTQPKNFNFTRVYYANPKQYTVQLYPVKDSVEDEYKKIIFPHAHIITYKQYYLINSFKEEMIQFKNITIQGIASMIFAVKEDEIYLKVSSDSKQHLLIQIEGYSCEETDLKQQETSFQIEDEYEHFIIFRRKL